MSLSEPGLSDDILRGANAIAVFLFGEKIYRRRVYHLASHSTLPTFKMGSMLCARKSALQRFIEEQEGRKKGPRA